MHYEVIYNAKFDCLIGKFTGDLNRETVQDFIQEISKMAELHNCKRFINDLRESNIQFTVADFFNASKFAFTDVFDRSWKRAIIVKKIPDKLKFFETTSLNQGIQMKAFLSIDEALEWL